MRLDHWRYGHVQQYAPIGIQIAADISFIETKESVHTKAWLMSFFLRQYYSNRVEFCHKIVIRVREGRNFRQNGWSLQNYCVQKSM